MNEKTKVLDYLHGFLHLTHASNGRKIRVASKHIVSYRPSVDMGLTKIHLTTPDNDGAYELCVSEPPEVIDAVFAAAEHWKQIPDSLKGKLRPL